MSFLNFSVVVVVVVCLASISVIDDGTGELLVVFSCGRFLDDDEGCCCDWTFDSDFF